MEDKRSGRLVVVSHCIMNVHSLEDELAIYPGETINLELEDASDPAEASDEVINGLRKLLK